MKQNHHDMRVWALRLLLIAIAGLTFPAGANADDNALPSPALPEIPSQNFVITDFGAVSDAKTVCTDSLKQAIEAATRAGGGVIRVPAGRFLTGPFSLASHVELRVDAGATLLLINDIETYPRTESTYTDWITATNCTDVAITGEGTIDGQGQPWWDKYRKQNGVAPTGLLHRPQMIRLERCTRVLVKNVTLTNSPNFHLIPGACREVTIDHVIIKSPDDAPNTDGIDPSGWNFRIANCNIDVGDDNIAIKPSALIEPEKPSCENFLVENCTFGHGHGMSIGGQTPGGLRNLLVRNCTFENTQAGIRLKASRGQGGLVENCRYEHLQMKAVKVPIYITSYYPSIPKDVEQDPAQAVNAKTPIWRNIRIEDVTATDCPEVGRIVGLPEAPVQDLVLKSVHISAKNGLRVGHAKNVSFDDCDLKVQNGPKLTGFDADVTGLDK